MSEEDYAVKSEELAAFVRDGHEKLLSFEAFFRHCAGKSSPWVVPTVEGDARWLPPTSEEFERLVSLVGMDMPEIAAALNRDDMDTYCAVSEHSDEAKKLFGDKTPTDAQFDAMIQLVRCCMAYFDYCNATCDAYGCDYPPKVGMPNGYWGEKGAAGRDHRTPEEAKALLAMHAQGAGAAPESKRARRDE